MTGVEVRGPSKEQLHVCVIPPSLTMKTWLIFSHGVSVCATAI